MIILIETENLIDSESFNYKGVLQVLLVLQC